MTKQKITGLFSIIAISALTVGCVGDGIDDNTDVPSAQTKTIAGTVIDDYLQGATACVDSNKNGKHDADEKSCAKTNATGQFTMTVGSEALASPLVMSGGTDVASKKPFTGTLTAPAGSTVINPLTTIVQAVVASGKSVADAQKSVKRSLNLPDVDLTSYDPIATLSKGTATEKANAKKVFAQQTAVQTILTSVAATVAASASGTTTKESDISSHAAKEIANLVLSSTTSGDITSKENIETIIKGTAGATDVEVKPVLVTALASQVNATSTQAVESISNSASDSITEIRTAAAQTSTVVHNNITATTAAIEAGTPVDEIVTNIVETATDGLSASIAAVTINTTALQTVATEATQPILTGAEGGN